MFKIVCSKCGHVIFEVKYDFKNKRAKPSEQFGAIPVILDSYGWVCPKCGKAVAKPSAEDVEVRIL